MLLPRRFVLMCSIEPVQSFSVFHPFSTSLHGISTPWPPPSLSTVYVHSWCIFNMFLLHCFVLICSIEPVQSFLVFHPFGTSLRRILTTQPPPSSATVYVHSRCVFSAFLPCCFVLIRSISHFSPSHLINDTATFRMESLVSTSCRNKRGAIVYFTVGRSSASSLQLCEDSRYIS